MAELAVILCPDSSVPEKRLRVILSFFGAVTICRPWFMDYPVPLSQSGKVRVLYPPDDVKPSGEFKRLLSEYRVWIRTSHDKGFDAFLAFNEQKSQGEEATWEIRHQLRVKGGGQQEDRKRNALRWNLFLHLAQEIQEEEREAQDLLRTLKKKDSPLKGLIEEEEPPDPLSDLPEREGTLMLSETGLAQVLKAWFCLFKRHLSGEEILLTLSPAVFQYLSDTWEEYGEGSGEETTLRDAVVLRYFPLLKRSAASEIARYLSGKTVGFIREGQAVGTRK
jgi:hypothetical protein